MCYEGGTSREKGKDVKGQAVNKSLYYSRLCESNCIKFSYFILNICIVCPQPVNRLFLDIEPCSYFFFW